MRTWSRNILAGLLVTVFLLGSTYALSQTVKKTTAIPIKVGVINGFTGGVAQYVVHYMKGHNVAKDEVNLKGGLLGGRPIQYILRDHKGSSTEAARAARELIMNEKVNFITGITMTPCAMAVSEVCRELKVIGIDGYVKTRELTEELGHPYYFTTCSDTVYEGRAMAILEKDTPYKKYWFIGWDYAYCHNVLDEFKKKLQEVKPGAAVIGETWVKVGEMEFTPYVTAIMGKDADAVVGMLLGPSFPAFCKQAKSYGLFEKLHMVNGALVGNREFLEPAGKDGPDGVTVNAFSTMDYPDTPENKAWNKLYLDLTGDPYVPGGAIKGYTASMVLFKGIQKAGTTDTEKVIKALEGMTFDLPYHKGASIHPWDHKTDIGDLWGVTKFDPNLGYAKLVDIRYISAKGLSHSEAEVKAIREAYQKSRK